jgi:acyl-CoA synthetase (NDP forming)
VVSHTGALAGSAAIWEGALRQSGAIEVSGVDEICDVLLALKTVGRRPGTRLMLSGGGGGLGTYAADLAEEAGLEVPPLSGECLSNLQEILYAPGAAVGNPLDIGAPLIYLPVFEAAMREAAANPSADVLVFDIAVNFAFGLGGEDGLNAAMDILISIRRETEKAVVVVLYSRAQGEGDIYFEELRLRLQKRLLEGGVLAYPSMPRAIRALSLVNS